MQENALPFALTVTIGAVGGIAKAIIFNKINEHYEVNEHYSIPKNAVYGALFAIPSIAACKIGSWPKIDKSTLIFTCAVHETITVLTLPMLYRAMIKELKTTRDNNAHATLPDHNIKTANEMSIRKQIKRDSLIIHYASSLLAASIKSGFFLLDRYLNT